MIMDILNDNRNSAQTASSLLEYKGRLTSDVRVQLFDLLKCIALSNLGKRSDIKKLIGIALELLDNAQRYNSSNDVDFKWHIEDSYLVVTIKNKATETDAKRLMEAVQAIDKMTPEEISKAFMDQLKNEGFGDKGGAGLGMLQIARKVGKNISAEVHAIDPNEYMCTSKVSTDLSSDQKRA